MQEENNQYNVRPKMTRSIFIIDEVEEEKSQDYASVDYISESNWIYYIFF